MHGEPYHLIKQYGVGRICKAGLARQCGSRKASCSTGGQVCVGIDKTDSITSSIIIPSVPQ